MLIYDPAHFAKHPRPRHVVVYTPTRQYGGLDVTVAGLRRQELPADCRLTWLLADDLYAQRWHLPEVAALPDSVTFIHWRTRTKPGRVRNLAATNNYALSLARKHEADLFVFLQDYIWIPPDGIKRFLWLAETFPQPCLISGLCHLTADPPVEAVVNPQGPYTIFAEPYTAKPQIVEWNDCRNDRRGPYVETPIRWECNWACIPRAALYDERLAFDEAFDDGLAFENQDYAYEALTLGYLPVVDTGNVSYGLPHKKYWAEQWAAEKPQTVTNQQLLARKNKQRGV